MRVSIVDFAKSYPQAKDLAAVVSVGMPVHMSIRISAHAHSLDEHDMDAPMPFFYFFYFFYFSSFFFTLQDAALSPSTGRSITIDWLYCWSVLLLGMLA